jgi:hypothetical protein
LPDVPNKQTLLVRVLPNSNRTLRDDLINGIRNFIDGFVFSRFRVPLTFHSEQATVFDAQTLVDDTESALSLLNIFFLVGS